tara:strand:+ start:6226 stop:6627 length:402 start_codon:yes stop_codon:yes gene_type:complete
MSEIAKVPFQLFESDEEEEATPPKPVPFRINYEPCEDAPTEVDRIHALRRALSRGDTHAALKQWLSIAMDRVVNNEEQLQMLAPRDIEGILRMMLAYRKELREARKERRDTAGKEDQATEAFLKRLELIQNEE